MARTARFKLYGRSVYHHKTEATVEIDRNTNLISVRPKHFKRSYEMRLQDIADIIMGRVINAEILEKRRLKKEKKKGFGKL